MSVEKAFEEFKKNIQDFLEDKDEKIIEVLVISESRDKSKELCKKLYSMIKDNRYNEKKFRFFPDTTNNIECCFKYMNIFILADLLLENRRYLLFEPIEYQIDIHDALAYILKRTYTNKVYSDANNDDTTLQKALEHFSRGIGG